MSARGIRNNNPGNIRASGIHWPGEGPPDSDGFCTFAQPEQGIAAMGANLRAYQNRHGLRTVNGIIRRWSATDQDVYVANVAKALGVGPDDEINVLNPDTLFKLVVAIIRQENGQQPYTYAVICEGLSIPPSAIVEHVETQPAAPIEDHSDVTFTVGGADNSNAVTQGGSVPFIPIMASLLPSILNLFAPRAQAALQKVTGQPTDVVQQFTASLFDKLGQLTGKPDPIQATAAITADPKQALVDALQEHALDYLDKLGPMIDKLAEVDQQTWAAERAGRDAAATRAQGEKWDMTPWLVWMAGGCVSVGVIALLGTILFQATTGDRQIDTALLTFAGPLITMAFLAWKEIFAYRFDGNKDSSATNAALTEMARQGAK